MLFNSFAFAVFFPIVFIVYWAIKDKYRNIWLLLASYWFYMSWNPKYIILILGITMVSFVSERLLEKRGGVPIRIQQIISDLKKEVEAF